MSHNTTVGVIQYSSGILLMWSHELSESSDSTDKIHKKPVDPEGGLLLLPVSTRLR
jgi:hypothetical protein